MIWKGIFIFAQWIPSPQIVLYKRLQCKWTNLIMILAPFLLSYCIITHSVAIYTLCDSCHNMLNDKVLKKRQQEQIFKIGGPQFSKYFSRILNKWHSYQEWHCFYGMLYQHPQYTSAIYFLYIKEILSIFLPLLNRFFCTYLYGSLVLIICPNNQKV